MSKLKTGKAEVVYLLSKAIEKYRIDTGQEIIQNTNRKNYEALAIALSNISNELPFKYEEWGCERYPPDHGQKVQDYPHRKYDITGGQIKDALNGIVMNPRPYLVDACYVYLFGKGRKAFELDPMDEHLLAGSTHASEADHLTDRSEYDKLKEQASVLSVQNSSLRRSNKIAIALSVALALAMMTTLFLYVSHRDEMAELRKDMNILPYQPTRQEVDSLEGIWLCYTGSPQARISDPNRYHKVVPNLIEVRYKDGYFTFDRYGASFDHTGYMQFESPGIVSVYSRIKNNSGRTESPRHSLLNLNTNKAYLSAVSTSWNFDVGEKNKIIGIREIYIKLGVKGRIEEVINDIENASCQCKVIRWHQENDQVRSFYLKNELLDSLSMRDLKPLIDEKSILLSMPQDGLVISKDSSALKHE